MKTLLPYVTLVLGSLATAQEKPDGLDAKAQALVASLAKEDFKAAAKDFDATMQQALPADKLVATWKALLGQVGAFQQQTALRREKVDKYQLVTVACQFEKSALDVRVTFDGDQKVAGLFFAPAAPPAYQTPDYVQRQAFEEQEVKVGAGDWILPATLSLPRGDGPFPAVVLVHGSGPHDRDETIGPNRPFRDLAWGLASRGIAVLRYEKRTKEHGARLAKLTELTIKEEVLDDALAAVQLLQKTPKVDRKKVFVLGHSLGALLAPRLGELDPSLAGLILLAAPTRPLEDLIVEQLTYLFSLDGGPTDEQKKLLAEVKLQRQRVQDPQLKPDTPAKELPLGLPAPYWLALRGYQPTVTAAKLKQPLLILQGERDYQVTMTDFAGWQQALARSKHAELKSYPQLNHLFAAGAGRSVPAEYLKATPVAGEVVADIAAWLKKQ